MGEMTTANVTLVTAYECPECYEPYEDARDASACCGGTAAWKCNVCEALYARLHDAQSCHPAAAHGGSLPRGAESSAGGEAQ